MPIAIKASTSASSWIGRILSGLVIAFLLMDAGMKLVPIQPVIEAMQNLGFTSSPDLARTLGVVLLVCTLLYTPAHIPTWGCSSYGIFGRRHRNSYKGRQSIV
jgi:hypothetical protein